MSDLVKSFARDFSASSLTEIAVAAESRATAIRSVGIGFADFDAANDFEQLACFARRIVALQEHVSAPVKALSVGDIREKDESGDRL